MNFAEVENTDTNPYDIGEMGCTVRPIDLGPILPVEDTCTSYLDDKDAFSECKRGYDVCVAKKKDALVNFD